MSVANCSLGRDVHLYAASDPTEVLCGLVLTNGVTNANFYLMVEIILIFDSDYYLQDAGDTMVGRDDHPFQLGNYYMVIGGGFSFTLLWLSSYSRSRGDSEYWVLVNTGHILAVLKLLPNRVYAWQRLATNHCCFNFFRYQYLV